MKKTKTSSKKRRKKGFEKTALAQSQDNLFDNSFSLEQTDEDKDPSDKDNTD